MRVKRRTRLAKLAKGSSLHVTGFRCGGRESATESRARGGGGIELAGGGRAGEPQGAPKGGGRLGKVGEKTDAVSPGQGAGPACRRVMACHARGEAMAPDDGLWRHLMAAVHRGGRLLSGISFWIGGSGII